MSEWQPIETAPEDRTSVLIAEGDAAEGWIIGEAYYDQRWWWANTGAGDYPESESPQPFPTHWMPLPAPPKETP